MKILMLGRLRQKHIGAQNEFNWSTDIQKNITSEGKQPTKEQLVRWRLIRELGCIVANCIHKRPTIHHCETGGGGRKNHDKVIGLCFDHHQGKDGIHTISRSTWEALYGTEQDLMKKTKMLLGK